jgi:hypothetical protein
VDAHHFDWFRASEIRECHGNTEMLQCGMERPCSRQIWMAPANMRYEVDRTTMLAPADRSPGFVLPPPPARPSASQAVRRPTALRVSDSDSDLDLLQDDELNVSTSTTTTIDLCDPEAADDLHDDKSQPLMQDEAPKPHVGNVKGRRRIWTLRFMPEPDKSVPREEGFEKNHPRCRGCGGMARPAILMFGDMAWEDYEMQSDLWEDWIEAVRQVVQLGVQEPDTRETRSLRMAIFEVGAGDNVPTVRFTSETCCRAMIDAGADVKLIRVNPQLPLGDSVCFGPGGPLEDRLISILGTGLQTIRHIDRAMGI